MSFRAKLILGVSLIQIILLILLFFSSTETLRNSHTRALNDRSTTYIDLLSQASVGPLVSLDLASLDELARQMLRQQDVLFVAIKNTDGVILAEARKLDNTVFSSFNWVVADQFIPIIGEPLAVSAPVESMDQNFGQVFLAYDTTHVQQEMVLARNKFLLFSLLQVALTIGFVVFLAHLLSRQFEAIAKGISQYSSGNFDYDIPVFARDETGRVAGFMNKMSRELAAIYGDLESRVEKRTGELRASNKKLSQSIEELEKTREELIEKEKMASLAGLVAGVAHEINTPIGVCVTAASHFEGEARQIREMYERNELTQDSFLTALKDLEQGSEIILRNAARASKLVGSFKQVAVDQTSHDQREFELKAYLLDIVTTLHPELKKRKIEVDVKCAKNILVDSFPGALSQIITNLLQNAFLHAFQGRDSGEIEVEAGVTKRDVTIRLKDNGVGIPEASRSKIFDPFFTTVRGSGGSGLGLHIVHNLVNQVLGGTIECQSEENVGTVFTIIFPLKCSEGPSQQHVAAQ